MNWKNKLEEFEQKKDWKSAIELLQKVIHEYPDNAEPYVRMIYLLHNILLEEKYLESEHDYYAGLLKQYFDNSKEKFSDENEYLFFVGKILYIGDWYFGIDDDFKPMEEKLAFKMQKKAYDKQPDNKLYKWAYHFSLNDSLSQDLATEILNDKSILNWLSSKGFPGKYILESVSG